MVLSVETVDGGQAKYDVMMVFCGNALEKHHKTLKSSTRRYPDCHILHILNAIDITNIINIIVFHSHFF